MPRITKTLIKNSDPSERRYYLWDSKPPGFGLAVYPSGKKSYVYQYRSPEGRTHRTTIASVEKYTPDQARDKAREWDEQVRRGGDPLEEKRSRRNEITVGELLDEYIDSEAFSEKARSTQETDRGRIHNHLKPLLGRRFAKKLKPEHIRKARSDIEAGKTANDRKTGWRARSIVRGGKGTARQSVRLLSAAYSWAIEAGKVDANPAANVKTGGDGERDIVMRDAKDYERLFATLDKMEAELRIRPTVADIIRIIALTGARREEITGLEWREIDAKKRVITIPPERHKTGRKTGVARIIGLPAPALAIIERQKKSKPTNLVFPPLQKDERGRAYESSRKGAPSRIDVSKPWRKVRIEAKLPIGIGLHGLRHSLATQMALQGAQASQIATVMGHRKIQTSQRYVHAAEDARARLAEDAASMISKSIRKRK